MLYTLCTAGTPGGQQRARTTLSPNEKPEGKGSRISETTQPVFKNAAYTQQYIDIANSLDGDVPGRRAARAYMDASTAIVHHRVENPRFAICDYLQNGVVDKFHLLAKRFTEAGYPCTVCDVRDLTFDGEVLHDAQGQPVHAIWRRCVTNDVLEFWDESQALIEAVKAQILTPDDGIADMADDQVQREPVLYNNLEGLYCYNGTFQGIFSRLGPYPTISKPVKGITCATIWVD